MEVKANFDEAGFLELIQRLYIPLNTSLSYAFSVKDREDIITAEFLAKANSTATRLEEILDHYNAKNNLIWRPFRENISAIKRFTDLSYITLHLKSTSPQYKLLSGIETFLSDTEDVLYFFSTTLYSLFSELVKSAESVGLRLDNEPYKKLFESISYPEGRLDSDFKKEKISNPEKVIVNLATSYLNLASESGLLKQIKNIKSDDYMDLVPDVISENSIRVLESKFHNLQSLYDTYISNTDIEELDDDLKLIRGHASIVYHLLEASTGIIHFYERHVMHLPDEIREAGDTPVNPHRLLEILVNYYINYSEQFLIAGKTLSKEVIKKYAEEGSIMVKVPVYRGFHVRPSTLVAKIVQHYGSEVCLKIDDEKFDASSPMNLFRVNEKINAEKRRNLALKISSLKCIDDCSCKIDFEKKLKEIFHELLEENKIINYAAEFALPEMTKIPEETLCEFANRAIANLLAQGKIDLKTDLEVLFEGDKRVLSDIQVLAECGYGEDNHGNNTILPEELSYIRR